MNELQESITPLRVIFKKNFTEAKLSSFYKNANVDVVAMTMVRLFCIRSYFDIYSYYSVYY
jgi:hypothetical protein